MKIFKLSLLILSISATVAMAAQEDERQPTSSQYTCSFDTGYGRAYGQGPTQIAALTAAANNCGDQLMDRAGNSLNEARMADIIDACNTKTCE